MISGKLVYWRKRGTKIGGYFQEAVKVITLTPDEIKLVLAMRRKFSSQKVRG